MMQPLFSFLIRRASFFWRVKQAYAHRFVINLYACLPFAVFASDTRKPACVARRFPPIVRIGNVGSFTQIVQSVVRAVIVDMVNLVCRPYAVCVKPRKAMRAMQNIVYPNTDIPVLHTTSRHITFTAFSPRHSPLKNTRIRIITDKLFQACYGKLGHFMFSIAAFVYINNATQKNQPCCRPYPARAISVGVY